MNQTILEIRRDHTNWIKAVFCLVLIFNLHCTSSVEDIEHTPPPKPDATLFESVPTAHSGLTFRNEVVQTQKNNHIINVEFISGAGVAVGDINGDDLPDLCFTANQGRDRLFLNKGDLKFADITEDAGIIDDDLWSTGVTFVDIDRDGDQDLYICRNVYLEDHLSENHLYINNGDLTFSEKASEYGLNDRGFSIQATFFDYNNDGLVDMYLVNQPPSLAGQGGQLSTSMASNRLFSDKLYENTGKGFKDVTDAAGLRNFAFGLSVTIADFNNDSWPDIYVTNDFDVPDHLYINQKDGTFENTIWEATKHISNFSMGSDAADYDNDGNLDLMVLDMMAEDHHRIKSHMGSMAPEAFWNQVKSGGHYQYMFNTLQRNNGNGTFSDLAQLAGVTNTDWSWAPLLADFDNDGLKDLFVTNGVMSNNRFSDLTDVYQAKIDSINLVAQRTGRNPQEMIDVLTFAEMAPCDSLPNYIFKNNGDYTFTKMVDDWGHSSPTLSNGAAYADLDQDGDLDLIVNNINSEALLYRNTAAEKNLNHHIRFKLLPKEGVLLYGTRVKIITDDEPMQLLEICNTRGYMSKSEDIAHFGLGQKAKVSKVIVEWTNGEISSLSGLDVDQLHTIEQEKSVGEVVQSAVEDTDKPLFVGSEEKLGLSLAAHIENDFDDYAREILLPHKMSQFGPSIAVGDANNDGREDFYLGGAAGHPGTLYLQTPNGTFITSQGGPWLQDKNSEDMGSTFVDINGDGLLDLFVVSGGNEFEPSSTALQDRLYLNQGGGNFSKAKHEMPTYLASGSCVKSFDYDQDGDLDLFVGGRMVPGKYPHPADSYLLENQSGRLVDVTHKKASAMRQLGMVTDADWVDYNNDGLVDLVLVGEWMPVTVFVQADGGLFDKKVLPGMENSSGWYYSIKAADLDNDGDQDIIAGNLGLNYKYKASVEEPFKVFSDDFDNNGKLDIVLSYYEHGEIFPVRGKDCSTQQIPSFGEKFETYSEFADANLIDVYGPSLENALQLEARTFASQYIENLGDGTFRGRPLPPLAQVSSVNAIEVVDVNQDGHKDIILCGNLFQSEIETPRNDAGHGLVILGDGNGGFTPLPISASGFFSPGDAKDMQIIRVAGQNIFLIANNDSNLQVFSQVEQAL